MSQLARGLVYVAAMSLLYLLAFVLGALWAVPTPAEPCAQPAILYVVVTPTASPSPSPGAVLSTPIPPLVLWDETLPRVTVTRVTQTPTHEPTETPTPAIRTAIQRG